MTDSAAPPTADPSERSPGALLRLAREGRGMHIASLAANIKVSPARLEALEADDYSGMPDTTFARALAQAVCRALQADPAPVLALMPESFHTRLERVDEGLNAPFRERPGGALPHEGDGGMGKQLLLGLVVLLLVGAGLFMWWPTVGGDRDAPLFPPASDAGAGANSDGTIAQAVDAQPRASADEAALAAASAASLAAPQAMHSPDAAAAAGSTGASAAQAAAAAAVTGASAAMAPADAQAASAPSAAQPAEASTDGAQLRALEDTWVQVNDGNGRVLLSRTVVAGETLQFTGPLPLRLRVGNVKGTELRYNGDLIDLQARTTDNTTRLSLPLAN